MAFIMDGRKYALNINSGIIFGNTKWPEYMSRDKLVDGNPTGIGMMVHMEDVEIDPVIVMNKKQAKELIKALRYAIRHNK